MAQSNAHRIGVGIAIAALMGSPCWAASTDIARGRVLAETRCAACHAIGKDDVAKHPEAPNFRDLHRRWPVEMMQESLAEGIMTGHPDMPEARFESDDIEAFLAYLNTLGETPAR